MWLLLLLYAFLPLYILGHMLENIINVNNCKNPYISENFVLIKFTIKHLLCFFFMNVYDMLHFK